jgi:hypothetical protein
LHIVDPPGSLAANGETYNEAHGWFLIPSLAERCPKAAS